MAPGVLKVLIMDSIALLVMNTGMFCYYTSLAFWLEERCCDELGNGHGGCDALSDDERAEGSRCASRYDSYFLSTANVLSVVAASYSGPVSDRVGRRLILMVSLLGLATAPVGTLVVVATNGPLWLQFPFMILAGLGGGATTFGAAAFSAAADVCTPEDRQRAFSFLESMIFAGGVVGPLLASTLQQPRLAQLTWLPFALSIGIYAMSFGSVLALPETLTTGENGGVTAYQPLGAQSPMTAGLAVGGRTDSGSSATHVNVSAADRAGAGQMQKLPPLLDTLVQSLRVVCERPELWTVLAIFGISFAAVWTGWFYVFNLWAEAQGFTKSETSFILSTLFVFKFVWLIALCPLVVKFCVPIGRVETTGMVMGNLAALTSFVAIGFLSHAWYEWLFLSAVAGGSVLVYPQCRAYVSVLVEPAQQGTVLCIISMLETSAEVLMPLITGLLFKATISSVPNACFFAAALLCLLSLCLAIRLQCFEPPLHLHPSLAETSGSMSLDGSSPSSPPLLTVPKREHFEDDDLDQTKEKGADGYRNHTVMEPVVPSWSPLAGGNT